MSILPPTDEVVTRGGLWLGQFLKRNAEHTLENSRIARAVACLLYAGVSHCSPFIHQILKCIVQQQRRDGGWGDPEETAWSLNALAPTMPETVEAVKSGCEWLQSVRHSAGGWGRHDRDICRIPTTALVCTLVPEVADDMARRWLANEWQRDLTGPVSLSYKAGFFLLAGGDDSTLVDDTILHLVQDQNDDGGFAPWRNHPIESDPWSTGVVLWGLSRWISRVDREVLEKALKWFKKTQLSSGVWPYHYIDDGASMAVLGITAATSALRGDS